MKLKILTTALIIFMSGIALAAPSNGDKTSEEDRVNYSPALALSTLQVVESEVRRNYTDPDMYGFYQDGDDIILRKKPGRVSIDNRDLGRTDRCEIGGNCVEFLLDREDLENRISEKSRTSRADASRALEAFVNSEAKALKKADEVRLVGLGSFYTEYCPKLPKIKGAKQMAKKTACGTPSDYNSMDTDSDGFPDDTDPATLEEQPYDGVDQEGRIDGRNPQTGKEIKIPAKNVVRGNGASGEMTVGEELRVNLPNGRKIVREVGAKK